MKNETPLAQNCCSSQHTQPLPASICDTVEPSPGRWRRAKGLVSALKSGCCRRLIATASHSAGTDSSSAAAAVVTAGPSPTLRRDTMGPRSGVGIVGGLCWHGGRCRPGEPGIGGVGDSGSDWEAGAVGGRPPAGVCFHPHAAATAATRCGIEDTVSTSPKMSSSAFGRRTSRLLTVSLNNCRIYASCCGNAMPNGVRPQSARLAGRASSPGHRPDSGISARIPLRMEHYLCARNVRGSNLEMD